MARQPLVGLGCFIVEVWTSHSDTPNLIGLPWTSDRPVTETAIGQITTLARGRHPCPGGIQTRNPSKQASADPRLRSRGLLDRSLHPLYRTRHTVVLILLSNMQPAALGMRRTYKKILGPKYCLGTVWYVK